MIETADTVKHKPSGETWYVAYCRNGRVCACGWPCSEAREEDCELIEKGTPEDREILLQRMAAMQLEPPSYYDPRKSYALDVLHRRAESLEGAGI